jgi:molybdopterin-guanine dinucleotide biosynthesis protein A
VPPAAGIVLAGGRGERLGLGIPKARAVLGGRTLLERAVALLEGWCAPLFVVAPGGMDLAPARATRVDDVPGFRGPLAGLVAGLESTRGIPAVVLGVDFPCVGGDLLRALAARIAGPAGPGRPVHAVVPRPAGMAQPLVAAYAPPAAARLRAALESGVTSLRGGLERLEVDWLDDGALSGIPGAAGLEFNVNTPEEFARAEAWLGDAARGQA